MADDLDFTKPPDKNVPSDEDPIKRVLPHLVIKESGGNPYAKNPASSAVGLTQLTKAAAAEVGVNPKNPEENLQGGEDYLRKMHDKFGDMRLALLAYRWGPGNVEKYGVEGAPKEMVEYADSIMHNAGLEPETAVDFTKPPEHSDLDFNKPPTPAAPVTPDKSPASVPPAPDWTNFDKEKNKVHRAGLLEHMNGAVEGAADAVSEMVSLPFALVEGGAQALRGKTFAEGFEYRMANRPWQATSNEGIKFKEEIDKAIAALPPTPLTEGLMLPFLLKNAMQGRTEYKGGEFLKQAIDATPGALQEAQRTGDIGYQVGLGKGPTPQFTLGQRTGNPEIIAREEYLAAQTPESRQRAQDVARKQVAAIEDHATQTIGKQDPKNVIYQIQNAAENRAAELEDKIAKLDAKEERLDQSLKGTNTDKVGATLRDIRAQRARAVKDKLGARDNALAAEAARLGVKAEVKGVYDAAKEELTNNATYWQDKPGILQDIVTKYGEQTKVVTPAVPPTVKQLPNGKTITLRGGAKPAETAKVPPADTTSVEDLVSLRRALNKEISVANMAASMGVQDAPTRQRALQKVKDALDQSFAKLEGEQNGNFGEKFKKLSAQWKTQYFDVFKRGTGGKMAREGYMGEIVDDGKIISQLVMTPGSGEGMRGMLEVIGGDPAGIKALHAGIIDKLVQGKEGALTQRQLDAFLSTHREALAQVPELRDRLTKLSGAYEEIATAKRGLLAEQKAHDASELAKAADKPVEEVIKTVLSNSKQLESTMAQMKTPSMKASLARAIADHVTQQPEPLKYLQEKELVLKPVLDQLGKDHWKNVSLIADAAEIQKRVKAPTVARLPGRGSKQ